jgi:LmbE family N-acetylglucosaminyl deacetylase
MPDQEFQFVRLVDSERRIGPTLASVSRHWKQTDECFLFISPHDDDVVIGGGLMIQSALHEGVPVHVAIVTDGSMGYCTEAEKETISDIRREETYAACEILGVPQENVHWLGFPDCQLALYQGRRPAGPDDAAQSHGFTGLQNALTELLRRVRPSQVFLPTDADLHPDHRIVHSETLISTFHAAGSIWPELGQPLEQVPHFHEMAIYCNFPAPPKLRIKAPDEAFANKLKAIMKFASQKQITAVVEIVERAGPLEYLRPIEFALYNPAVYKDLFDTPPQIGPIYHR